VRLVLVGSAAERARLRAVLAGVGIEVVGEAPTLAEARAGDLDPDAYLLASDGHRREAAPGTPKETLTPREVQVVALLAEGLPNKAIATRLGISDQTVKFHVASICGKLGASNRTEAVRLAVRRGIVIL
jgi:DNA-binding NarL/FixJ family response regulator